MVVFTNRQYLGLEQERQGNALRVNVSAPFGGLNTRDSESAMEATDALTLTNWFPDQGAIKSRKGYTEYATGLTGDVESLMEYRVGATSKFLCANSTEINDITTPASITNLKNTFTSARWQHVTFNGYLIMVNGADTPQTYDGTTLANSTISGSGLTPSTLDGINIHKNRVYVWDSDSQDFWYGGVNAIGGTFTKFQLSRVAPFGGNLVAMATWNIDAGDGVDDLALFIMSTGDVVVYQGSDPGDATNWSLVGVFKIGSPISSRAVKKIAGDVVIVTNQDFIFFSKAFKGGGAVTESSKLSGAAIEAAELYSSNYGWQVELYPKGGWLIFNVPVATNTTYIQYVVNTITGAACKFTNMNARVWGVFNKDLYFGESGKVMKADNGFNDNGTTIALDAQSAFSNLGTAGEKTMNSFRNTLRLDGSATITNTVNFDYGQASSQQTTTSAPEGALWDATTSLWDSTSWSPEGRTRSQLIVSSGSGVDIGMRLQATTGTEQISWYRTDYSVTVKTII